MILPPSSNSQSSEGTKDHYAFTEIQPVISVHCRKTKIVVIAGGNRKIYWPGGRISSKIIW